MEERLLEQRLRILLGSLPDTMIVVYDHELRCQLMEGPLVAALGYQPTDYDQRSLAEILPVEAYSQLEPAVRRALSGTVSAVDYRSPSKHRDYHVEIAPLVEDGEVTGAFSVWRDVTERLTRERQAMVLAAIVEQSEDAILAKDTHGVITEWNRGAESLYGYCAADAIGRHVSMLVPDEREGEDRWLLAAILTGNPVRQYETVRLHRDGNRLDVSISISPIRNGDGTIVGASIISRDITARVEQERTREAAERQLQYRADHDALTGLLNRTRFESELERAIALAGRYRTSHALLAVDLDGFKRVNDTLGHSVGDELLIHVAQTLTSSLRQTDLVARIGGDEFAVLLPHANAVNGGRVAEKLLEELRHDSLLVEGGHRVRITASVGMATFDGSTQVVPSDLFIAADMAMYAAKRAGKDGIAAHA